MEENKVENIVTYANILEMTKRIVKEVGYEFQAILDDAILDEIVSGQVMACVTEKVKEETV